MLANTQGCPVAYISGEEAADQVRLRARRLGLGNAPVKLGAATSVRDILATLDAGRPPALLVIDSIQTMHSDAIEGAPGYGEPGPRLGAGADPLRQGDRLRVDPCRPRHQGRGDRRARACSSIWSTPCSVSRASAATNIASCARSRIASAAPTRSACSRWRRRGWAKSPIPPSLFLTQRERGRRGGGGLSGAGGHAATARRDPGVDGSAGVGGDAPACGGRLGFGAAGDDPRGARGALRAEFFVGRSLSQRRGRLSHHRSRRRSRGRRGAGVGARRTACAAPMRSRSARSRCRANCDRWRMPRSG